MKKFRVRLAALGMGLALVGAATLVPSPAFAGYTEWQRTWGSGSAWGGIGAGNVNDGIWGARAYDGSVDGYAVIVQVRAVNSSTWRTAVVSGAVGQHIYNHQFKLPSREVYTRMCLRSYYDSALALCETPRYLVDDGTG